MKKSTWIWIVVAVVVVIAIVAGYLYWRSKKKAQEVDTELPAPPQTVIRNVNTSVAQTPWPLRKGSRGEAVKIVQNELKTNGFYTAAIDGSWGDMTEKALNRAGFKSPVVISEAQFQMKFPMQYRNLYGGTA